MNKGWRIIKWASLVLVLLTIAASFAMISSVDPSTEERAFAYAGSIMLGIILGLTLVFWCLIWLLVVKLVQGESRLLRYVLLCGSFLIALTLAVTSQVYFPVIR